MGFIWNCNTIKVSRQASPAPLDPTPTAAYALTLTAMLAGRVSQPQTAGIRHNRRAIQPVKTEGLAHLAFSESCAARRRGLLGIGKSIAIVDFDQEGGSVTSDESLRHI
jgi:hypothetical protein